MKKALFLAGALACAAAIGAHAQQVGIDSAIWSAAAGLSAGIDSGANVAVVAMQASTMRMSDYLINEMIGALIGLQGADGFTTLGRAQFDLLMGGLSFDTAGWVDGTTAQAIGRLMDVQYVITGVFEPLAGFFRFRTQVIDVETASIRGMHTVDVQNDALVAYLLRPPAGGAALAMGFTPGQRFGTFGLNWLLPGLGSFVIMRDTFGGVFQVICGGTGFILMVVGFIGREVYVPGRPSPMPGGGNLPGFYDWEPIYPALIIGSLLMATQGIFNIVRSATFRRNAPRAASIIDPEAWSLAIAPGPNGIGGVSLSRTLRL